MEKHLVTLVGVITEIQKKVEANIETIYDVILEVPRQSGVVDRIPISISDPYIITKETLDQYIADKEKVVIKGMFCNRRKSITDIVKVDIEDIDMENVNKFITSYINVRHLQKLSAVSEVYDTTNNNSITFTGNLSSKAPVYTGNSARLVIDFKLCASKAVANGEKVHTQTLRAVAWQKNAKIIDATVDLGDLLTVTGRLQSREIAVSLYQNNKDSVKVRVPIIEVSVNKLQIAKNINE